MHVDASDVRPLKKSVMNRLTPREREKLRLRSKAIPLVADKEPLDVIFEDDSFLVVNKPAYIKMHPSHRYAGMSRCSTKPMSVMIFAGKGPGNAHAD